MDQSDRPATNLWKTRDEHIEAMIDRKIAEHAPDLTKAAPLDPLAAVIGRLDRLLEYLELLLRQSGQAAPPAQD